MGKKKESKVVGFEDEEFRKLFAAAIITIGYCEMYPDLPSCQDEEDFWEEEDWEEIADLDVDEQFEEEAV